MSGSTTPIPTGPTTPNDPTAARGDSVLGGATLPVLATAFTAGLLLGTRSGRHLTRGVLRTGLMLLKPTLLIGGLLKLRELSNHPSDPPRPPTQPPL